MTPYNEDMFEEIQALLAKAKPEQIARLLSDIALGEFSETAETRAGSNDNQCNVTNITCASRSVTRRGADVPDVSAQKRRAGYSS